MKTTRVKLAGFLEVISKIVAKIVGAAGVGVRSNLNDIIISSAVSTWRNSEGGRSWDEEARTKPQSISISSRKYLGGRFTIAPSNRPGKLCLPTQAPHIRHVSSWRFLKCIVQITQHAERIIVRMGLGFDNDVRTEKQEVGEEYRLRRWAVNQQGYPVAAVWYWMLFPCKRQQRKRRCKKSSALLPSNILKARPYRSRSTPVNLSAISSSSLLSSA
ncbi:hypothetical protein CPB85DRAFT_1479183 [Mucidula mucida]|nr:hypothetical protein CPB85DRAFT_1479183 [Mucidula mucida]